MKVVTFVKRAPIVVDQTFMEPATSCYRIKKLKVKLALEQATKAQRGSRGIALLFL